jgi:hypothetical protein
MPLGDQPSVLSKLWSVVSAPLAVILKIVPQPELQAMLVPPPNVVPKKLPSAAWTSPPGDTPSVQPLSEQKL